MDLPLNPSRASPHIVEPRDEQRNDAATESRLPECEDPTVRANAATRRPKRYDGPAEIGLAPGPGWLLLARESGSLLPARSKLSAADCPKRRLALGGIQQARHSVSCFAGNPGRRADPVYPATTDRAARLEIGEEEGLGKFERRTWSRVGMGSSVSSP
jgi:hypothetical protein